MSILSNIVHSGEEKVVNTTSICNTLYSVQDYIYIFFYPFLVKYIPTTTEIAWVCLCLCDTAAPFEKQRNAN